MSHQSYALDVTAPRTIQWYEYPSNVPLKGRMRHWKYFKDGIILDRVTSGGEYRAFHYTDSKGHATFISLNPSLEFIL